MQYIFELPVQFSAKASSRIVLLLEVDRTGPDVPLDDLSISKSVN